MRRSVLEVHFVMHHLVQETVSNLGGIIVLFQTMKFAVSLVFDIVFVIFDQFGEWKVC